MTSARNFNVISGSERKPVRGARLIHDAHPDQSIEVSIRLRSKAESTRKELKTALEKPVSRIYRAPNSKLHTAPTPPISKRSSSSPRNSVSRFATPAPNSRDGPWCCREPSAISRKRSTWNSTSTAIPREISAAAWVPSACPPSIRTSLKECSGSTIGRRQNRISDGRRHPISLGGPCRHQLARSQ